MPTAMVVGDKRLWDITGQFRALASGMKAPPFDMSVYLGICNLAIQLYFFLFPSLRFVCSSTFVSAVKIVRLRRAYAGADSSQNYPSAF
jgi:hypothetical protein